MHVSVWVAAVRQIVPAEPVGVTEKGGPSCALLCIRNIIESVSNMNNQAYTIVSSALLTHITRKHQATWRDCLLLTLLNVMLSYGILSSGIHGGTAVRV